MLVGFILSTGIQIATRTKIGRAAEPLPVKLWQFRETHLGVDVEHRVYAADEAVAKVASQAAYARIDELNQIFSDYDTESEISRLCRTQGAVKVSPELWFLLTKAELIHDQTDGAFDVTVGPLIKQWRRARRKKELPTAEQIATAQALIGMSQLKRSAVDMTVEIQQAGMQLDFGGIAKGYVAEEAYKILATHGCPQSLVSVAGDIFAGDAPPDSPGWRIGIAPLDRPDGEPSRYVNLEQQAISTSGDAFQYVEIAGVRYSHIVDSKTGLGLTERSSVTVIAPHGWMADGYATAVCLVGPQRGLKLLNSLPKTAGLIVTINERGIPVTQESTGFADLLGKQ